jgi:hypothetical protein
MRKKIYTLIAAGCLLVTSLSAQQEGLTGLRPYTSENGKYSQTVSYFLKAVKGSETYYIVLDDHDRLVLRSIHKLPSSFGEVKNALWTISFSQSTTGETAFSFSSLFRATLLSLSRREVSGGFQEPGENANLPGGDIYRWLPSAGSTTFVNENFFYVFSQTGGDEVIAVGADKNLRVVPRGYANFSEAAAASDILKITLCVADGFLPLTANDLNVRLSASPFIAGQKSGLIAREKDRFTLVTTPAFAANYPFSSGYTYQAQGVHVEEDVNGFADVTKSYRVEENPFADTLNYWVALYAWFPTAEGLGDQGFIGVDTSYLLINGTEPNEKAVRIASFGDTWYHNEPSSKRLLDSYLFKFLYDPALNRLKVISHGHATGAVEGQWGVTKEDLILANKYALNTFLTASFIGSGRYAPTLTTTSDEEGCYIESRDEDPYYSTIVEPGLYYLRVTGSQDRTRIGKYLRIGLGGALEFVSVSDANYQYQPSYHWAIESMLYMAKVFNREVPNASDVEAYFGSDTRTYGVEGQKVFVMSGGERDTLAYTPVSAELKASSSVGYYLAGVKDATYSRVNILYYGNRGTEYVTVSGNNVLWVQGDSEKAARFGFDEVYAESYGYDPNYELEQAGVRKLERRYYRFTYPHDIENTLQYLSYDKNTEAHRFSIGNNREDSPLFLLREIDRSGLGEPAYLFYGLTPDTFFVSVEQPTLPQTNGALYKEVVEPGATLSLETLGRIPAFVLKPTIPYIYIGIRDNNGKLKTVQDGVQIFRTYAYDNECLVGKPNLSGETAKTFGKEAIARSFNYLALQALGDDDIPESFTLRHVRGTVMPQYLILSDYRAGTGDVLFTGKALARLDRTADNPAYIYAAFFGIAEADLSWYDSPRLGFIPITVKTDGMLYIDGKSIIKVVFDGAEREEEGFHNRFLFSFRLPKEEKEGFLIEGGYLYPNAGIGSAVNSFIRVKLSAPIALESSYVLASQELESLFSWKLPDGTIQFPPMNTTGGGMSLLPPAVTGPSLEILAGRGGLHVVGAEGKQITLTNLLGQRLESRLATASEEYFEVPSGVIVVSVEGVGALKALIK